jgi:hypothetical protein
LSAAPLIGEITSTLGKDGSRKTAMIAKECNHLLGGLASFA